jgi:RNA polymerase primary sigma factor
LAEAIGVDEDEIALARKQLDRHLSIDAPFHEDEPNSLLDTLIDTSNDMPDAVLMTESLKIEIQRALSMLTYRESEVVTLYFGLDGNTPLTLEELGDRLHLTRERVRQIKEKATRRLRHASKNKSLKLFL